MATQLPIEFHAATVWPKRVRINPLAAEAEKRSQVKKPEASHYSPADWESRGKVVASRRRCQRGVGGAPALPPRFCQRRVLASQLRN